MKTISVNEKKELERLLQIKTNDMTQEQLKEFHYLIKKERGLI